jgi:hypothetical protein
MRKLLFWLGLALVVAGAWILISTPRLASTAAQPGAITLGWGMLILGFLNLASAYYFKLRDARRSDRAAENRHADLAHERLNEKADQ